MRETVVFLPGFLSDARAFGPQIADLSRDHAVMCAAPVNGERIEEIASTLLDVLPKRCALVGHGMGGVVALELIRRAPDRIARMAIMSAHPLAETPQQAAERDPRLIRTKAGRFAEVLDDELRPENLALVPHRNEVMELLKDMALGLGPEIYTRQSRALQRRRDQQGVLRRIAVPVLILCGEEDPVVPVKRHNFMAELIPGARLEVLAGAGHYPALEQPEAVAHALRGWLQEPLVLR